jgi:hypothetical protein
LPGHLCRQCQRQGRHTNKQPMICNPPRGPCPSRHPFRNQLCFAHNPLRGGTTQRKPTTPGSPKGFKDNTHTPKRHATPMPAHPAQSHFHLLRTACAPTSIHSNCFCAVQLYGFVLARVRVPEASPPCSPLPPMLLRYRGRCR